MHAAVPPTATGASATLPNRKDWLRSRAEACAPLPPGDRPREVEGSPLHRAVRLHRAAFVAAALRRGLRVPRLVKRVAAIAAHLYCDHAKDVRFIDIDGRHVIGEATAAAGVSRCVAVDTGAFALTAFAKKLVV